MPENIRYIETVGRRKTATARVRLTKSSRTTVTVNNKELSAYFPTEEMCRTALEPLQREPGADHFSITALVRGGGTVAQSEALRHGIARALIRHDVSLRHNLKKAGFLKRDPRVKERRKFGLKKARKAPQWAKR